MSIRVVFAGGGTGGHLYPALNIAAALRELSPDVEPFFVGARRGVEARVLPDRGVEHRLLPLEPIYRDRVWRNWRLLPAMVATAAALARLTLSLRPRLVVGTGGYASGPACGWAVAVGIPVAIQEQNSYPGLTTRWLCRFARQIHLGFPEAEAHLRPGRRTEVRSHGNPIHPPAPPADRSATRSRQGLRPDGIVLLVVGGSQGARAINQALLGALEAGVGAVEWPDGLEILWSTGPAHIDGIRTRLSELGVDGWVHAVGYIDDMPAALAAADLAISRAGAMGTAELLAWGIPSILVPLPTAAADHQTHNARALDEYGAAVAVPQADASPARLRAEITALAGDAERRARMSARARARSRPDAAARIAADLARILEAG